MRRLLRLVAGPALALGVLACGSGAPPMPTPAAIPRVDLAIVGATVVDVRAGRLLPDHTILVRGDTIVDVVPAGLPPAGARAVDARGLYAMPGLWDMHVHVLWEDSIPDALFPPLVAAGVTGVRDMGGTGAVLRRTRDRIAAGGLSAPRIVAAGPVLDGPQPVDPSISIAVQDSAGAVAAVDSIAALGADLVKVYTMLPASVFPAVMAAARAHGLPVAGHLPHGVDPLEAARAGMRGIEHLRDEIELLCGPADSIGCAALADVFASSGLAHTPTLVVLEVKTRVRDTAYADPTMYADMPPVVASMWRSIRESKLDRDDAYWLDRERRWRDALWLVGFLHRRGVDILAGSDTPVLFTPPGESLHRELELLVQAGLSPLDALRSATTEPAAWLGIADRHGAIAAGGAADLVLLRENPMDDISAVRAVAAVVLRGRYLPPENDE